MLIQNSGPDAQLMELTDYISAARVEKEFNAQLGESPNKDVTAASAQQRVGLIYNIMTQINRSFSLGFA